LAAGHLITSLRIVDGEGAPRELQSSNKLAESAAATVRSMSRSGGLCKGSDNRRSKRMGS
jgi:hypothetical protein